LDELDSAILTAVLADHPMTVRGVFYRVMSAGAVTKTEQSYRAVQRRVLALRRSGQLPYSWISDGTRLRMKSQSWTDLDAMLRDAASSYRRALWRDQDSYVEIWSEKGAISSIVFPVTDAWDVPLLVARGFSSETFLWNSAEAIVHAGKPATVYQLGDWDPSGLAAWEQIQSKLTEMVDGRVWLTFERIAITEEQIGQYDLPTRPTRTSDSRSRSFAGDSVEVDALPSGILRSLVEDAIRWHINPKTLAINDMVEANERRTLEAIAGVSP
jgi:hypothetical protein